MKLVNLKNPVMASWLREQGFRLDAPPFLSGAIEARKLLEQLTVKKERLSSLTEGHNGGIFNGPKFSRIYVDDPDHGVPFVGSADMLLADLSRLPLLQKKKAYSPSLAHLKLEERMTLISCSGTIGRMVYVRADMAGIWSSQHIMKVVPNPDRIPPGYLYAFLSSKFGLPLVVGGTYGAIIQHIEPQHIADLHVPRFGSDIEERVHKLVHRAAQLRTRAAKTKEEAKQRLAQVAELHELPTTSGSTPFCTTWVSSAHVVRRLDAFYHSTYHREAVQDLRHGKYGAVEVDTIAESVVEPNRFKRIPIDDPKYGIPFFGTAALMRIDPDPTYYLARKQPGIEHYIISESTLLVPRSGQLSGIIGVCVLPYGKLIGGAVTEDAIRIKCRTSIDAGFLFIALNKEHGIRQLKACACGSSIPHLDVHNIRKVLIPKVTEKEYNRIGEMGESVRQLRNEAIGMESEAHAIIESAIKEAA